MSSKLVNKLRDCLPKNVSDAFSLLFLIAAVLITFLFELTVVIPYVHRSSSWRLFHSIMGSLIVHNIIGNLWFLIATDTSTRRLVLSSAIRPGWRFCACCEANCPPRAFHCPTCDCCVLKRDHHCAFAGKCVGYFNFRYFWSLLVHIAIGGAYATILNMFFIWDLLGGFGMITFLKHTFPLIFWLFGKLGPRTAAWTMISVVDLCGTMFVLGLLSYHTSLMMGNQTNYERNKSITTFNLGNWRINFNECLGRNWHLILISPLIASKLPRDGIKFPNFKEYHLSASKSK